MDGLCAIKILCFPQKFLRQKYKFEEQIEELDFYILQKLRMANPEQHIVNSQLVKTYFGAFFKR